MGTKSFSVSCMYAYIHDWMRNQTINNTNTNTHNNNENDNNTNTHTDQYQQLPPMTNKHTNHTFPARSVWKYGRLYMRESWIYFFWLGTKILPYVQFTYFNIFSEDPSGSFTKICDVALPRLLRITQFYFGPHSLLLISPPPNNY